MFVYFFLKFMPFYNAKKKYTWGIERNAKYEIYWMKWRIIKIIQSLCKTEKILNENMKLKCKFHKIW